MNCLTLKISWATITSLGRILELKNKATVISDDFPPPGSEWNRLTFITLWLDNSSSRSLSELLMGTL